MATRSLTYCLPGGGNGVSPSSPNGFRDAESSTGCRPPANTAEPGDGVPVAGDDR
jgi:hypothetical protein